MLLLHYFNEPLLSCFLGRARPLAANLDLDLFAVLRIAHLKYWYGQRRTELAKGLQVGNFILTFLFCYFTATWGSSGDVSLFFNNFSNFWRWAPPLPSFVHAYFFSFSLFFICLATPTLPPPFLHVNAMVL